MSDETPFDPYFDQGDPELDEEPIFIDQVEMLGAQVDEGILDWDTAVNQLIDFSDGDLNRVGAEGWLRVHKTARAQLEGGLALIRWGIDVLTARIDAKTPDEVAFADVAVTALGDQDAARIRDYLAEES